MGSNKKRRKDYSISKLHAVKNTATLSFSYLEILYVAI